MRKQKIEQLTITRVVVSPLSIQNVVHRNNSIILTHGSTSDSSKFLHMAADSKKQSEMDAQGTDIGSGLTTDPEDCQVSFIVKFDQLGFIDRSNSQLTFDGRD
jgi:hypothetical protein